MKGWALLLLASCTVMEPGPCDANCSATTDAGGTSTLDAGRNDAGTQTGTDGGCATPTWRLVSATMPRPVSRGFAQAAYSPALSAALFFGGASGVTSHADLWSFDGAQWRQLAPVGRAPGAISAAASFDVSRDAFTLFGGWSNGAGPSSATNDTWVLADGGWSSPNVMNVPAPRGNAVMAYDARRKVLVMFGGILRTGVLTNETWDFDGVNWLYRATSASPPARESAAATFDAKRNVVVVIGGADENGPRNDVWEFDGTDWRSAPTGPEARQAAAATYDDARQVVLLFGGRAGPVSLGDSWSYDGTRWTALAPGPAARHGGALVHRLTTCTTWLFSGRDATRDFDEVWALE